MYGPATVIGFRVRALSAPTDVFRDRSDDTKSQRLSQSSGLRGPASSRGQGRRRVTRGVLPFSSSYKVYFVKSYSMNVHLVKWRYK